MIFWLLSAFVRSTHVFLSGLIRHQQTRIPLICLALICSYCKDSEKIPSQKEVVSFSIRNVTITKSIIDHANGKIEISVPFSTILSNRTPDIVIGEGATIVPSASVPQDFTQPVFYTITGLDGSKKIYKVTVITEGEPDSQITAVSKDTIQAGDTLLVTGENLGSSVLQLSVFLKNTSGTENKIPAKLIDASHLRLYIPSDLQPGLYQLILAKNNKRLLYKDSITIRIPTPKITDLLNYHLLQGDTLVVAGNYILPDHYQYKILLDGKNPTTLIPFRTESGKLSAVIPVTQQADSYELSIHNVDENTTSIPFNRKITVYSKLLPFIRILNAQENYTVGQTILFKAINFQSLSTRFYTIQLTTQNEQYNQNGIYDSGSNTLSITVPADLPSATYSIRAIFLDSYGKPIYELELDNQLMIQQQR